MRCCKVQYETDANRRKIKYVKDMRRTQLGYYGQSIKVMEGEKEEYRVIIDMSIMDAEIVCKEIEVEKRIMGEETYFWQDN